jgi:hypothetical protein
MNQETQALIKRMQAYLFGESSEATALLKDAVKLLMKEPEDFSWELEPRFRTASRRHGLFTYLTQSDYDTKSHWVQGWYRPIRPEINLPNSLVVRDAGNSYDHHHDSWCEGYDEGYNECILEVKRLNNL